MRVFIPTWLSVLVLCVGTACSNPSTTISTTTSTSGSMAPLSTTSATVRPTMVPGGRGQTAPTTAQIDAMAGWAQRHLDAAGGIIHDGEAGTDKLNTAIGNADVRAAKAACEDTTQPVTIRLPAVLPTPDPDMTNGFQSLVDAGNKLAEKCEALTDPPTPTALKRSPMRWATSAQLCGSPATSWSETGAYFPPLADSVAASSAGVIAASEMCRISVWRRVRRFGGGGACCWTSRGSMTCRAGNERARC